MEVLTDVDGNVGILLSKKEAQGLACVLGQTIKAYTQKAVAEAYRLDRYEFEEDEEIMYKVTDLTMYEIFSKIDDIFRK